MATSQLPNVLSSCVSQNRRILLHTNLRSVDDLVVLEGIKVISDIDWVTFLGDLGAEEGVDDIRLGLDMRNQTAAMNDDSLSLRSQASAWETQRQTRR